jgi:hypothetical protein
MNGRDVRVRVVIEIKLAPQQQIMSICKKLAIEAAPGLRVYAATENGKPLGCCGFEMSGDKGTLCFTAMEDASLSPIEDGLLRSALSLMFESGVATVDCKGGVPAKMLVRLGFKGKNGVYSLNLNESFLTRGCCCGKDKNK